MNRQERQSSKNLVVFGGNQVLQSATWCETKTELARACYPAQPRRQLCSSCHPFLFKPTKMTGRGWIVRESGLLARASRALVTSNSENDQ